MSLLQRRCFFFCLCSCCEHFHSFRIIKGEKKKKNNEWRSRRRAPNVSRRTEEVIYRQNLYLIYIFSTPKFSVYNPFSPPPASLLTGVGSSLIFFSSSFLIIFLVCTRDTLFTIFQLCRVSLCTDLGL